MPTQRQISITIDAKTYQITPGAIRGHQLKNLANLIEQDQLYLEVARELDVPVELSDLIFLRGGETFSIGGKDLAIPENPIRRNPVKFILNDQETELLLERHSHAKASGIQLKSLVGAANLDLWSDLDGLPDVLVDDHDVLILQPGEIFFTVEREAGEPRDRFVELVVILNGERRSMRFPKLMLVEEAIRRILPSEIRVFSQYFVMHDESQDKILEGSCSIFAAGVKDGGVVVVEKADPELRFFFVNSKPRTFKGEQISYEELVLLVEPSATFEFLYTVSYVTLSGLTGMVTINQVVKIEEGEDFRVRKTNRS